MTYVISEEREKPSRQNYTEELGGTRTVAKAIDFVFQFPPIYGVFDTGHGTVYVFGELHENEIEDILAHETLHFVVQKIAGKRASLKLDRVYAQIA